MTIFECGACRPCINSRAYLAGDIGTALFGRGSESRHGLPFHPVLNAVSPMAKTFGIPGTPRSGPTLTRPALSHSVASHFAAGEALTPAAHSTVLAAMVC